MTLFYLPGNRYRIGLDNLKRLIYAIAGTGAGREPKLLQFYSYLEDTWLPLCFKASVFNRVSTTTNVCELSHRYLKQELGAHSHVYDFLGRNREISQGSGLKLI